MCWSEGGTEQWQCHFASVIRDTIHTAVPWTPLRTVHLRLSQNSRKLHSVTPCPWSETLFTLQFHGHPSGQCTSDCHKTHESSTVSHHVRDQRHYSHCGSQNSRTFDSVTCSLVHRISHNTDDGNGKCGQQFICSRRLSCSSFRQTPTVQYIYDKSLSSTEFEPNILRTYAVK